MFEFKSEQTSSMRFEQKSGAHLSAGQLAERDTAEAVAPRGHLWGGDLD